MVDGDVLARPPLGFVVEGHGEYFAYPSYAARILGVEGLHFPRINAHGIGNILTHLEEHLTDLTRSHHPYSVMVTADLRDAVREGYFEDCLALVTELNRKAHAWLQRAKGDGRLRLIPRKVGVVVQIQQFETWLVGDETGVMSYPDADMGKYPAEIENIDDIMNPARVLEEILEWRVKLKNPEVVRTIVRASRPEIVRRRSRSFDKFCREIESAYARWREAWEVEENDHTGASYSYNCAGFRFRAA